MYFTIEEGKSKKDMKSHMSSYLAIIENFYYDTAHKVIIHSEKQMIYNGYLRTAIFSHENNMYVCVLILSSASMI